MPNENEIMIPAGADVVLVLEIPGCTGVFRHTIPLEHVVHNPDSLFHGLNHVLAEYIGTRELQQNCQPKSDPEFDGEPDVDPLIETPANPFDVGETVDEGEEAYREHTQPY